MQEQNPLLCDPDSGVCEVPLSQPDSMAVDTTVSRVKPVKIIYFTDPICSSCWGIEPQLRKLKLVYGASIEVEYRMGGLLPDWSYNSGGISKPSDVASHWDEVSVYYDMPIDGDVWLEDPLHSSYPPSIAFKAAQIQSKEKAIVFLRAIREMVFLKKINITKWVHLEQAAKQSGLDVVKFKLDYEGKANQLFQEDLNLGRSMGVRGFPTMFFVDTAGKMEKVYGSKPYAVFESALLKLLPQAPKKDYKRDWQSVFAIYPTLTANEYAVLTDTERKKAEQFLNELTEKGNLVKLVTKNGSVWSLKQL
ncbi:MAG: DsbA family protein [Bacteroidetes bacterium]|nr:DsbA family protein [Bacteroidota bacterium]